MQSRPSSRSTPEFKLTGMSRTKKFQQDYQTEENPEILSQFLLDSQLKESQNKQRLYQTKREGEGLRETLVELEAQRKKLEFAKDINQKFFKKNESEILGLRKPLEDPQFITDTLCSSDSHELLRKKVKEIYTESRRELDSLLEKQPDFNKILQTSETDLGRILDLLKSQISIFTEDVMQKEQTYRHMQDRYQGEFDILSEQHQEITKKINDLAQDKKNDMQRKYGLERKIAYLEADVEVGTGYMNAQKLALSAAKEINNKIQKADTTKSLTALSTKIQRRINATKQI